MKSPCAARARDTVVPVEVIVVVEVSPDALEVEEHVFPLLLQEEARGHALPPRDGVALARARAHQLVVLLGELEVLLGVLVGLAHGDVHNRFDDVLRRGGGLQLLHEIVCLFHFPVVKVEDDEVQACLRGGL